MGAAAPRPAARRRRPRRATCPFRTRRLEPSAPCPEPIDHPTTRRPRTPHGPPPRLAALVRRGRDRCRRRWPAPPRRRPSRRRADHVVDGTRLDRPDHHVDGAATPDPSTPHPCPAAPSASPRPPRRCRPTGWWPATVGVFAFGGAPFYGSTGRHPPQPAGRRHGRHLAHRLRRVPRGGLRRGHLHLRRRPVLRLDRQPPPQPADRRHGRHPATATATGWWPPTAGSSPTATPGSTGRPATSTSTSRSSAWPPPRTATATGWWPSDGGVFAFGDATFYGLDRRTSA